MGTGPGPKVVLLLLSLSAYALADSAKCKAGCHGSPGTIFAYEEGSTYIYSVEGTTVTSLTGTKGDGTKLTLKATAELSIQPNCAQFIKLSAVSVTGPDGKVYDQIKDLEKHPMRFNFHDGHIDAEVCTAESDSHTALNVKRAIASLFQVAAAQSYGGSVFHEVDVFGSCPTQFAFSKDGDTLIVRKERNLNRCAYREDFRSDIISVGYSGGSPLQSTPIMGSTMKVTQKIKNRVIDSAESTEEYFYRPLSNRDAGAKTIVETKIKLASTKKQAPSSSNVGVQRSIIFDSPHKSPVPGNTDAIVKALNHATEHMKSTVGETSAHDFSDVIQVLRQSRKDDILKAHDQLAHKKVFYDALLRAGTGDAIEAGVELIKKKAIKDGHLKIWYLSLGFVRHATAGSLLAVSSLIDANSPRGLILGAGALAGRFCREHNCEGKSEYNTLVTKLTASLGSGCKPKNKDDENKIIASLKALHNTHHLNDGSAKILSACASDSSLPARIRVNALESFLGGACIPMLKETALKVLKNIEEDSEIRIKAYLALVECPNGEVANALKNLIENEPSSQVGAFIVSHLRNLRASANPDKDFAKAHLGNIKPVKRFPNDLRKFSRNFEVSTLVDLLNIGASMESNVIFSQRSYVPRSASFNLTTDVFGHSVNILELGIRAENVDRLLEHVFGPKGYVRSHDVKDMYHDGRDKIVKLAEKITERFSKTTRGKRSVSRDQINALSKKVSLGPKEFDAELDLDLSVKVFGFEGIWLNYQGGHDLSPDVVVDKIFDSLDTGIEKAKNFNYDFRQHYQFLDTELSYPTGLGFPLRLSATGNAAIHLKLDGSIDIHSIIKDPLNAQAKLHVVPSAAVEINGLMLVDGIVVSTGLKLATTIHTATGSDVTVKVLEGSGIDVNFGLPLPKQDVITLKSEIFSYKQEKGHAEVDTPLSFTSKRKDYHGCFDQVSPFIGLTFCSEVGFPVGGPSFNAAFFPLNGPAKVSVRAEKDDEGMTGYRLKAHYNKKNPGQHSLELLIDTPGSKTNRKLSLVAEGSTKPDYAVKVALISPWKQLSVEGQLLDNDKNQMLVGKFVNDKAEYSVKAGLDVTGSSDSLTYAPVLEYNAPGRKEALTGKDGKKQPVHIEGTITVEKKGDTYRKYKFNAITLTTPMGKYGIDGTLIKDTNMISHDVKLTQDKNSIAINTKLQKLGEHSYKAHVEAVPAQFPDFSFAVDWDYKRGADQVDHNLAVAHGANLKAAESRLTINQEFKYKIESITNFDVATKQKVTYPLLGVDVKFDGAASRKSVSYDLLAKYDNKKLESKLSAKSNTKAVGDYELNFMAKINDKGVVVSSKREKPAADKSKLHHSVELTPGGKYELISDVTYNFEKNNIKYQGDHALKLHQQPEIKVDTGLSYKPGHLDAHTLLTVGGTTYLDTSAKLERSGNNPSGNYKILIKDYLDSHGELKFSGGKGSANFVVDIPKVQRKIKGTADLTSKDSNYKINADLLWNADKDPSQKLHFETDTDIARQLFKTKNTLIVLDWKTQFNFKREIEGGTTALPEKEKKEIELIIPDGRKFTLRYDHDARIKPTGGLSAVDGNLYLEDKNGGAVRSTSLKISAKDVDSKHAAFDSTAEFVYKSPSGKDLTANIIAKNIYGGDQKWTTEGKVSAKGAYLPKPVEYQFNSDVSKSLVTYKLVGHGLTGVEIDVHGKVNTGLDGNANNRHADTSIDIKLPIEQVKNIKLMTDWTLTSAEGSPCQVGFKNLLDLWEKVKTQKSLKLASAISLLAPGLMPSCEFKARNEFHLDEKTFKLDGGLKADLRRGAAKVILTLPNEQPRSLLTNWVQELDQETPKMSSSVALGWDGNKDAKIELKVEGLKDFDDIRAKLTGSTNTDKKHKFEVEVYNKRKGDHAAATDVSLTLDDKKLRFDVDLDVNDKTPKVDLKVEHAGGTSRFKVKTEKKSDKEFKSEGTIEWALQGGGKLDWEIDSKVISLENFKIKGEVNSEKLKIKDYKLEIANNPGDKSQIVFSCKSGDENILSGSTSYQFKEQGKTWLMEGSGNVQLKNEARSSHFKYSRTELNLIEDKEVGFEHKLDVDFGGKESIQLERKLTNRQQRALHVICNKDKKCARVEFDNIVKTQDLIDFHREVKIVVDLKSLGLPHDFNLHAKSVRHGRIADLDAEINMDTGAENTSISGKLYAHETSAGAILNFPKRTVEFLASAELPKTKEGSLKGEVALWLDKKRQPNLKSALSLLAELSRNKDGGSLLGEARFVHPGAKEMSVSGRLSIGGGQNLIDANLDLDVFADKNQKVVLEAKVAALEIPNGRNVTASVAARSKGLALDVEVLGHVALSPDVVSSSHFLVYQDKKLGARSTGYYVKLSKEKFVFVAKLPGAELLKIISALKVSRDTQSFDSTVHLFGLKPVVMQGEVKDFNSVIGSVYRKEDPDKKLSLKGGFAWGQVAEIRATRQSGDKKDDLFFVTIALDESHFLQTEYGGSFDNVKSIIEHIRKDSSAFVNQARIQIADAVLEGNNEVRAIAEEMKKAKPDVKTLVDSYQKELNALADELANEKLAKEVIEILKELINRVSGIFNKIWSVVQKYCEILEAPLKQLCDGLKQTVAKLSEHYAHLAEVFIKAVDQLVHAAAQYMSKIVEIVRKHEDDIKKVATVVGQGIRDIGRIVSKAVGQIRHEVEDFVKLFMEQLKALPINEILKERYQQLQKFQIPEQTWNVIHDMMNAFVASMPTHELAQLLQAITQLIEKHLKHEKVDDFEELKTIAQNAISASKSIVKLVKSQLSDEDINKIIEFTAVPLPGSSWFQLPIFAPIHLSPLKWLRSGDLPSLSEYFYTYRPTLNPLDWVPPYKMYGILVDSHNFYTFDRKYFNFKGACSYVLAQDFVDGNFSLIVNLEGGKFKSVLLNDAKDSIELLSDMSILVNGKPQDFPALQGDLTAWRRYDSANVRSRAGVFVTCDLHRQVCQFFLSGFYFGKTRGLLGNMNYEQYDDMILPSGKITNKVATFGNAWKVNAECNDVPEIDHSHAKESYSDCSRFFGGSGSSLSSCFPYVNPIAFRTACEHTATEAKSEDLKKKTACNLAFAYAQACQYDRVRVDIPSSCASCSVGSNSVAIGDSVSVKTPQTMADIILVIEQVKPNDEVFKELVAPLIASLSNDLKAKGITDVHYSLLGFGAPNQKWPAHFTSDGELSFEGKTTNIWFGAAPTVDGSLDSVEKKVKWVKHEIDLQSGNLRLVDAFKEASDYPFRAGAVKSIIGVMGQPCHTSLIPFSLQHIRTFIVSSMYRSQGLSLHIITPLESLALSDEKSDDIVGFDSEHVYSFSDSKKKPLEGNTELHSHLQHDADSCIKVALGSQGAAFSSNKFLQAKPPQRKQFIHVFSQRVTESLAGGEITQDCKCSLHDGLHSKINCKVTDRIEKRHG